MLTLQNGRRSRGVLALGAAFVLGVTAVACDEFLKPRRYNGPTGNPWPTDGGYTDGGDAAAGDPYACLACVQSSCATQQAYCNQSSTCLTIQQYDILCGYDLTCTQYAIDQGAADPQGQALYVNLLNCERSSTCGTACRDECQPPASYCR